MLYTILIIILILVLIGGIPNAPWYGTTGSPYGWGLPGGVGLIVLILIILVLSGRL
jgi:hypothetical protein